MTDDKTLVEELRRWEYGHSEIHDAADRIEDLIAENERLRKTVGDRMEFYLNRIEALSAENERLTEREAQAKLDGVRAGIEAAKEEWTDSWTIFDCRIRALDAEAIAKGEG